MSKPFDSSWRRSQAKMFERHETSLNLKKQKRTLMKTIDLSKEPAATTRAVTLMKTKAESEFHNRSTTPNLDKMMKVCLEELEPVP